MSKTKSFLYSVTWLLSAAIGCALIILAGVHLYLSPSLPSVESLRDVRLQTPLRIYSNDGKLIGEIGEKRRTPVQFEEIPQAYIDALLSAEDAQFYSHRGVSIKGLMRAMSQLLMSGDIQGGGSTITMQVARNFFLTKRQEFKRKFNEILLALRIERELSKQEILELYVNVIFLGNRAYGIQAAAQVYYGKTLDQLNLPQLAMIAGMPKAPSTMNPLANPERALQRRNWIIGRMYSLGKIDENTFDQAIATPISARYHGNALDLDAPYIAEMARQHAVDLFGPSAYTDGYRVYTTVNSELQIYAQQAVIEGLLEYDRRHGYRGPEQVLDTPDAVRQHLQKLRAADADASSGTDNGNASAGDATTLPAMRNGDVADNGYREWQENGRRVLDDIPAYAGLQPALIIAVADQSASALLADGREITLQWEHGLAQARPYLSVNSVGEKPETASDVVDLGHIVRVRETTGGEWEMQQLPTAQAALVSLSPRNGAILALVGGLDFHQSNFNRVTQAYRQPGSNFKPFVYTAALENGFTAASLINDAPIVFDDAQLEGVWRPENDGGNFYGPTRLRTALYRSRNLVSIRILRSMGIGNALNYIGRFGFNPDEMPHDLSLALGSHAVTPLDVAEGYAVLANGGYKVEPYYIDRILDFEGKTVWESLPPTVCRQCETEPKTAPKANGDAVAQDASARDNTPFLFQGDAFEISREVKSLLGTLEPQDFPRAPRVVEEETAYIMDSILKDVVRRGTGTRAKKLKRSDLAGKTGTTNMATDAWFSGYGGGLVTTTWIGFDQVSTLGSREYGGTAALPIWIHYMGKALAGKPETPTPRPPGLVTVRINPETGKRAHAGDANAIFEMFRSDRVPELDDEAANGSSPWDESEPVGTDEIF